MTIPIILVAIAVVGGLLWGRYSGKKHKNDVPDLATKLNLQYSAKDPFTIDKKMPHNLFKLLDARSCENVIWGTYEGIQVTEFDYECHDTTGRDRTYLNYSCVLIQIPVACAPLLIGPENAATRLIEHGGFNHVAFESEAFNHDWFVKSADPKFATDMVDQRMMEWLTSIDGKKFSFETAGPIALVYSKRRHVNEITKLLDCAKAFHDHIPRVVESLYPVKEPALIPGQT